MATNSVLWHYTNQADAVLPSWVCNDMYMGKYSSPNSYPTASLQSNLQAKRSGKVTNGFMKALCRAKQISNGSDKDGFGSNGNINIAEMTMSDKFEGSDIGTGEIACVAYDAQTGVFQASIGGTAYKIATQTSAPLFLALWPLFMQDTAFAQTFSEFCASSEADKLSSCACYMADIAYSLTASNKAFPICAPSAMRSLSNVSMGMPKMKPTSYIGHFQKFGVTNMSKRTHSQVAKKMGNISTFTGAYAFSVNKLTTEQELLVPKLDSKYVINETLITCCEHIKATTGRPRPIRNILLRGEPGTGKSETYVGIAAGCHLPLYTFAANAMTEPFDLFGQFVPVDENGEQSGPKVPLDKIISGLPSANDMSMDPVLAYQEITGLYKADATATDCMTAAFNLAQKSIDVSGGQQKFKFVPGQLIYAMKNGGVWGFDEVTLPQNPGVVPALNPAMDNTQSITLPTGEIIKRHPDCIFVGTTNIDLEGCRRMNQAWQDRCQLIIDMQEPDDAELITRIKAMTGFDDAKDGSLVDLDKFVRAYHEFKKIAKSKRLDDGTIGPRKLADWVTSTLVTGDPVLSAKITIIPGATADKQGIAELEQKLGDIF